MRGEDDRFGPPPISALWAVLMKGDGLRPGPETGGCSVAPDSESSARRSLKRGRSVDPVPGELADDEAESVDVKLE